ncbi:MAG: cytochrome c [Myxococcota bacterium]
MFNFSKWLCTITAAAFLVTTAACGGGHKGAEVTGGRGERGHEADVFAGPIASVDIATGEAVWSQFCEGCHPGGGSGVGPAVDNAEWSAAAMRRQVRLGEDRMPGFGPNRIDAEELEALLAYLKTTGGVIE